MKFFFPDSQDLVDPSFNFTTEKRSIHRVRQRDDLYPHEILTKPPYDGILVSKAIVDTRGRYTLGQKRRLFRHGIREFFRLDEFDHLETMGDCGAFSYVAEEVPPVTVDEVIGFYEELGFDYGVSVDHIILAFREELDHHLPNVDAVPPDWRQRREITLELANEFLTSSRKQGVPFEPIGVAQGWSPESYAQSVKSLQQMGFTYIGLGGLVPLRTPEILSILNAITPVRATNTRLHLFGVNRTKYLEEFARLGTSSFDSTSPLRRAFKDSKKNYYTADGTYMAIRVPQVDANPKLKRRILSGEVKPAEARKLERRCLENLEAYDCGAISLDETLNALADYQELCAGGRGRIAEYERALRDRPWKQCRCGICDAIGIHVILFRGAERNRRRGFHNLAVVNKQKEAVFAVDAEHAT